MDTITDYTIIPRQTLAGAETRLNFDNTLPTELLDLNNIDPHHPITTAQVGKIIGKEKDAITSGLYSVAVFNPNGEIVRATTDTQQFVSTELPLIPDGSILLLDSVPRQREETWNPKFYKRVRGGFVKVDLKPGVKPVTPNEYYSEKQTLL